MVPPVVSPGWWESHRDEVVLVYVLRAGGDAARGGVVVDLERWLAGPPSASDGRHPLPWPEVFAEGMAAAGARRRRHGRGLSRGRGGGFLGAAVAGPGARVRAGCAGSVSGGRGGRPAAGALLRGARSARPSAGARARCAVAAVPRARGPGRPAAASDVLRSRFAEAGVVPGAPVVAYCGSGVTACHGLLVMEHLGLGTGRLYPGSWSQYASDPERAVELG